MSRGHHLGELQYAIMRVLWRGGEKSVAEVADALPIEHRRALTTIATMLSKMERKGVVRHRTEGRSFVYVHAVSERDVRKSMVSDLTERLFQGDVAELVSHLMTEQEVDPTDLRRLEDLIAARQHGRSRGGVE